MRGSASRLEWGNIKRQSCAYCALRFTEKWRGGFPGGRILTSCLDATEIVAKFFSQITVYNRLIHTRELQWGNVDVFGEGVLVGERIAITELIRVTSGNRAGASLAPAMRVS